MNFSSSAEKERHIGQELEEMIGSHADLVSCFFLFFPNRGDVGIFGCGREGTN